MNEVEQETVQDNPRENNIEWVSINSIQFNKNHSVSNANFKMLAGQNNIVVPGSDGNIMPLHICKNIS